MAKTDQLKRDRLVINGLLRRRIIAIARCRLRASVHQKLSALHERPTARRSIRTFNPIGGGRIWPWRRLKKELEKSSPKKKITFPGRNAGAVAGAPSIEGVHTFSSPFFGRPPRMRRVRIACSAKTAGSVGLRASRATVLHAAAAVFSSTTKKLLSERAARRRFDTSSRMRPPVLGSRSKPRRPFMVGRGALEGFCGNLNTGALCCFKLAMMNVC